MPRFVVLRHEMPADSPRATHWDFMLEWGDALRTWALEQEPRFQGVVLGSALPDHRLAYLEYEGPVAGDRGCVTRVDAGSFAVLEETKRVWTLQLNGRMLHGYVAIVGLDAGGQRFSFSFTDGSPATAGGAETGCCGS